MYLVAAKSLYACLGRGAFVLIDDGSLTDKDRATLRHHLDGAEIISIGAISTVGCPKGGTWERLLTILDMAKNEYVIQLDADTLTLGPADILQHCIDNNIAFTQGTNGGRIVVTALAAAITAQNAPGNHVQDIAERALSTLKNIETLKYVRGCSGFAGFAKGGPTRETIQDFSAQMQAQLGERWNEWGSEQVASNFVVANSPEAMVLPFPAYRSFMRERVDEPAEFLHFIGPSRYDAGVYTRLSKAFIRTLT